MRLVIALMVWLSPMPVTAEVQPRFPAPVDLCGAVGQELAARLVPGAAPRQPGGYCVWEQPGAELSVALTWGGEPWDKTSAEVHEKYRRYLATDLQSAGRPSSDHEERKLTSTKAQVQQGIGDEAYSVDEVSAVSKQVERVEVTFRAGNLPVWVEYFRPGDPDRVRQGALSVSRRVSAALDRLSPPEPKPTLPPGTYADPPLACVVLTPEQVAKLVDPEAERQGFGESATCDWGTMTKPQLNLEFWTPQRGPAGDGVAQAKETFAGWRDEKATPLELADEALTFPDGPNPPTHQVVVFRKGNLIGYVRARDPAKAEQAARWIVEAQP